ncbi:MAG: class I SAM-dependent methyltransferase [Bacteroidetes bacterium]|nr:class I SAM-dependent methyltransferase [Bacteroidota bacterium]
MTLRNLFYKISPNQRYYIRRFIYFPYDFYENITGKKQKYIPPRGMVFTGRGDYLKQANIFFQYFKQYCDLQPDYSILDIGSGVGRMAVPFIGYLNDDVNYEGIDIVKTGVDWCNKHISVTNPQFNFIHSDIYNDLYNTKGIIKGEAYTFPYKENKFDLVFLTSVFTHMLQAEVEQYIKEISRVLKPNGYCLATFFILNKESETLMNKTEDTFKFPYQQGDYSLMSLDTKTANVAYKQEWIESVLKENGLKIEQMRFGFWSGRQKENFPDFQDIIIMKK